MLNNDNHPCRLSVVHAGTGGRSSSSGRAPTASNDTILLNFFERRNSTSATTAGGSSSPSRVELLTRQGAQTALQAPARALCTPCTRSMRALTAPVLRYSCLNTCFGDCSRLPQSWPPHDAAMSGCMLSPRAAGGKPLLRREAKNVLSVKIVSFFNRVLYVGAGYSGPGTKIPSV